METNISNRQGFIALFVFLTGGIMALGGSGEASRNSFLTPIAGIVFVFFLYKLYFYPFYKFKSNNYFEIIKECYGDKLSIFINSFFAFISFFLACFTLSKFGIFIKSVSLERSSLVLIVTPMLLVALYASFKGFKTITIFLEMLIVIIVFFMLFSLGTSYTKVNISNLLPIFNEGIFPILNGTYTLVTSPFMESFFLICLMFEGNRRKSFSKFLQISMIISCVLMFFVYLRNLLVIGHPALESLYYPSYSAISLISLGDFFERQEVLVSIIFIVSDILKLCVYLIFTAKSINFLAKTSNFKKYLISISVLSLFVCLILFKNNIELFAFLSIYRYILTIPLLIIPIITLIIIKCKKTLNDLSSVSD